MSNWQANINNPSAVLEGAEDIAQCVYLILTTIKGSDPLRADFGSDVYKYIDKPLNENKPLLVYAVLDALEKWEKRISVTKCTVNYSEVAKVTITIEAEYIPTNEQITLNVKI